MLGLEGEFGYLDLQGNAYAPWLTTLAASSKIGDWYGMITGRLGYTFDRAMVYVKGGAAFVNAEASIYSAVTGVGLSASEMVTTWTVGGGLEYALDMNWSVKAEYMYIGMNDTLQTAAIMPASASTAAPAMICRTSRPPRSASTTASAAALRWSRVTDPPACPENRSPNKELRYPSQDGTREPKMKMPGFRSRNWFRRGALPKCAPRGAS